MKPPTLTSLANLSEHLSSAIGIDLGTSVTIAGTKELGVFFSQSTLVAVNTNTGQVIAIGKKAREMIDRVPPHIKVVSPIRDGVVNHYDVTVQLFKHIFRKAQQKKPKLFGPKVIVGIPCCASSTEIDALVDAATDAGARSVGVVDEPLAAAVGIGLSVTSEEANMVVDVGGGTSDALVFAAGEIIVSDSIRIGGEAFDVAIIEGLKQRKNLSIGVRTAEDLKKSIMDSDSRDEVHIVHGTSTLNQLPLQVQVTRDEIFDFIAPHLNSIVEHLANFIEGLSPEVQADLTKGNVYFVGGGQLIHSFAHKIEQGLNISVAVPSNPLDAVAYGAVRIAQDARPYEKYFLNTQ